MKNEIKKPKLSTNSRTLQAYLMKKEDIPVQLEELQAQLLRERKAHEKEIKRLEKELAVEKLYGLANKTMIDLAEKKYNIRIRNIAVR